MSRLGKLFVCSYHLSSFGTQLLKNFVPSLNNVLQNEAISVYGWKLGKFSLRVWFCQPGFVSPVYGESNGSVVGSSPSYEHADFV